MSSPEPADPRARHVVQARLGRKPQDMLEAAVVLEAWTGLRAADALAAGREIMASTPQKPQSSVADVPSPKAEEHLVFEALGFVVAVVAIACWAGPLGDDLGAAVVERALILALPLTLTLQWGLRSRYLGRPDGLALLGRRPPALALLALAIVGASSAMLGQSGWIAGLLTLTWTGGTILIRRGWFPAYSAAVIAAAAAMLGGAPAAAVLEAIAGLTTCTVAFALRLPKSATMHEPGRWERALKAAAIGAGLGCILVIDRSVSLSIGSSAALAMLPSTIASFWGGYHLWRFHHEIPRVLSGIPVVGGDLSGLAWSPLRILLGAVLRLVFLTVVLSVAIVGCAARLGAETSGISVLVGFGLVALATLLVSLLESVGRAFWGLVAVAAAVLAEAVLTLSAFDPVPGAGLLVGGTVTVAVALPAAIALLCRPADTLATSLWIT